VIGDVSGWWCRTPSSKGFSTISMAGCTAAISLTRLCTHWIAWLCSGGSCFPTTTPPQLPSVKHSVLLLRQPSPRLYRHFRIPKIPSILCNMQNWHKNQLGNETSSQTETINDQETRIQTKTRPKKPPVSILPPKSPPLIFCPVSGHH
jgi:hypothetical protein